MVPGVYEPRATTDTVLHQVVRAHLDRFLADTTAATDGVGLPRFIVREFRDFLGCGQLERGFARVRCEACRFERLIPFSCKARAICPSCGGRRMAEQAAHLVDAILPWVPVRQWVLTVPHRLRYRLAFATCSVAPSSASSSVQCSAGTAGAPAAPGSLAAAAAQSPWCSGSGADWN